MPGPSPARPLRADAARNTARILRAAREIYARSGPDASLEDIARHADVGIATLYRRFPNKAELVRAALEQSLAEEVAPAIERALAEEDPRRGIALLVDVTMATVARDRNLLATARGSGVMTTEIAAPVVGSLSTLVERGQRAGVIRGDLVPDDALRLLGMLTSVLWTMPPCSDGWRRYATLLLDALAPSPATPLPGPVPLTVPSP